MNTKRAPTLADLVSGTPASKIPVIANAPRLTHEHRALQSKLAWAEKFVFDRDASQRVATVLRDIPELLVEQIQFARPPFDLCWIEYDLDAMIEILNPPFDPAADPTRDHRVGVLIHHNRITVATTSFDRKHFGILPFAYHLNTEWPVQEQILFAATLRLSRIGIDDWLWGSCADTFRAQGKQDYLRLLRNTNMVELLLSNPPTREVAMRLASGSAGDLKNHLAMLLMLNQPRLTQYVAVPATRGWIGNKHGPFRKFTHVRVALDPVPLIRQVSEGRGDAELRRRHPVRGHYCHSATARQAALRRACIHDWQASDKKWQPIKVAVGDEPNNWVCLACSGRRWWQPAHERGDAGRGYVEHRTYEVTR